ncbi:hypothetical protein N9F34_01275 [Alphaproteobacteria bacterium]|nr:hypothetical protein [Alphaproteobacteria bacterium]
MSANSSVSATPIEALWKSAVDAYARKSFTRTIRNSRCFLTAFPDATKAWLLLARALEQTRRLNAARIALDRLGLVAPIDVEHRRTKVRILLKLRMHAKAWHDSRALVVLNPDDPRGWEYLARGRAMLGRADEVQRFLGPLSCLRPDDPAVALAWSRSLMESRDLQRAETWCRLAISKGGENPERLFDLARILRAKGEFLAAEKFLNTVVALDPRFALRARAVRLTVTGANFVRPDTAPPNRH